MAYTKTNWSSSTPINTTNLNKIEEGIANVWEVVYPVGSIYTNINNVEPSTLFGGTWEQIKDRFLLSAGDTYEAGTTGGEAEHTLTINEMPEHNHGLAVSGGSSSKWGASSVQGNTQTDEYAVSSTGQNQPHNNMPPYLTVYMWRRTA